MKILTNELKKGKAQKSILGIMPCPLPLASFPNFSIILFHHDLTNIFRYKFCLFCNKRSNDVHMSLSLFNKYWTYCSYFHLLWKCFVLLTQSSLTLSSFPLTCLTLIFHSGYKSRLCNYRAISPEQRNVPAMNRESNKPRCIF